MADDPRIAAAVRLLADGVGTAYPGAVLGVDFPDDSRSLAPVGRTAEPGMPGPVDPVTSSTLFDQASLTKPLVTVPVFLALARTGCIGLGDRLGDRWPRFASSPWADVTMAHLLAHTSGMPAWRPFAAERVRAAGLAAAGTEATREWVVDRIVREVPEAPPGTREIYSDLGFIVMGMLLERLGGASLDRLFHDLVARPLGLHDAFFVPVREGHAEPQADRLHRFAATEVCPTRRRCLRGEVDDENAWLLGGVAGHAGLFASAVAVLDLVRSFVAGARGQDGPFAGVVPLLNRSAGPAVATRAMGFDTPAPQGSAAGDLAPSGTFGHLGFTGTSFWAHPETGAAIVLLTNRVHPDRRNDVIRRIRPTLHDAVWEAIRSADPN